MSDTHILTAQTRPRILAALGSLDMSKPWELTLRPWRKKRSDSQNRRLWKLHGMAASVVGVTAEEMHEYALCRFFGYEEKRVGGIIRQIPLQRSSQQKVKEFAEFMTATEEWYISEFGVWLDQEAA